MKAFILFVCVLAIISQVYGQGCGAYNQNIYICCNGNLQLRGGNDACCGSRAYQ